MSTSITRPPITARGIKLMVRADLAKALALAHEYGLMEDEWVSALPRCIASVDRALEAELPSDEAPATPPRPGLRLVTT